MFTRKNLMVGGISALALLLALVLLFTNFLALRQVRVSQPRLLELERFRVRLLWGTNRPSPGQFWYKTGDKTELSVTTKGKSQRHSVDIGGLLPETVYNYRLSQNSKTTYSFKTAPLTETAFRYLVYNQDKAFNAINQEKFIRVLNEQLPDFVILTGRLTNKKYITEEEAFFNKTQASTRIPIFMAPSATDLKDANTLKHFTALSPKENDQIDYAFDYGNSRFIVLTASGGKAVSQGANRAAWLHERVSAVKPLHVFVFILEPDSTAKEAPELFQALTQLSSARKIDAVFSGGQPWKGTVLAGTKVIMTAQKYAVIDVDGEGVTGSLGKPDQTGLDILTINETPEAVKRSCIYCRKLLDTQRYQESIDWYRKFIKEFGARYMVDDAQFEIANIYDQYLFNYPAAIQEYQKLLTNYPNSSKSRQASQRVEYLTSYADFNYEPLRIFEKAKSQTYQRDKKKAITEVQTIQSKYPGSKLEPQVLYWLGYTLAESDLNKSAGYYQQVTRKYQGKSIAYEAWVALGDAYYLHKKYHQSIKAYQSAMKVSGDPFNFGLLDKIRKSERNIVRDNLANAGTVLIIIFYPLAIFWRPRYFKSNELKQAFYLFLGYLAVGTFIWVLFCRNYPELIKMLPLLALAAATAPLVTSVLFRKLGGRLNDSLKYICITGATLLLSVVVLYVFFYYYYSHYLTTFGL